MLGHGVQSDIRVGNCLLQELLLQCHHKHAQNLVVHRHWHHITVRMHEVPHETLDIKAIAILDGVFILSFDFFSLLRMVGLLELFK